MKAEMKDGTIVWGSSSTEYVEVTTDAGEKILFTVELKSRRLTYVPGFESVSKAEIKAARKAAKEVAK